MRCAEAGVMESCTMNTRVMFRNGSGVSGCRRERLFEVLIWNEMI